MLLENALINGGRIGSLPAPLAGCVFHFDTNAALKPCEAAFVGSMANEVSLVISPFVTGAALQVLNSRRHYSLPQDVFNVFTRPPQIEVLVLPSNLASMTALYRKVGSWIKVVPLYLSTKELVRLSSRKV